MFDWDRLFKNKPQATLAEVMDLFKADPVKCFSYRGEPYHWRERNPNERQETSLGDMRVCVDGYLLGYVESVSFLNKTATIRHIATLASLTRQGLGPLIARAYAKELGTRYGIDRIILAESHSKFVKAGYPGFFRKIGATPLPHDPRTAVPGRYDYEWLKVNW